MGSCAGGKQEGRVKEGSKDRKKERKRGTLVLENINSCAKLRCRYLDRGCVVVVVVGKRASQQVCKWEWV
jgi:hypothetical protein